MDWNAAIERHRTALKRVLAPLVSMAGFDVAFTSPLWGGRWAPDHRVGVFDATQPPPDAARRPPHQGEVEPALTLPRHLHRAVLRLLRPAEAAVRRLVIVAARDVHVPPPCIPPHRGEGVVHVALRTATEKADAPGAKFPSPLWGSEERARQATRPESKASGGGRRLALPYPATIALPLFDPLRRITPSRRASTAFPRISIPGWSEPAPLPVPHTPYDAIDARRLTLRLAALARALDDLPREARRFARWRSRDAAGVQNRETGEAAFAPDRDNALPWPGDGTARQGRGDRKPVRFRRLWPLRLGRPPGQRAPTSRQPVHAVHQILDDVHGLAFWALEQPDTS